MPVSCGKGRSAGERGAVLFAQYFRGIGGHDLRPAGTIWRIALGICRSGVMSNTLLKERLTTRFGGRFAPPDLSADNAAGIALLGAVKEDGLSCL